MHRVEQSTREHICGRDMAVRKKWERFIWEMLVGRDDDYLFQDFQAMRQVLNLVFLI